MAIRTINKWCVVVSDILWEQPGSTKDEVAERAMTMYAKGCTDYSDSTKNDLYKESQYLGENWLKYTEYLEVPSKVCELLGCYSCVHAKFVEAYKGCYCTESAVVVSQGRYDAHTVVLCCSYEAKETISKESAVDTSGDKP